MRYGRIAGSRRTRKLIAPTGPMNEIARMLRDELHTHEDFKDWFAAVMTTVVTYGNKRAELAIASGSTDSYPITVETYEALSPLAINAVGSIADLRDLIGGRVEF